ncbi:Uncharacterised protein [Shigella boydii]|uniref:Uncharacterized protein n=1 Tax=Shigella boydii TaxID=621 RepID=A0A2X2JAF2_SHIBO|nr:Uncharacterised protein [Shigella boydii]
MLKKLLESLNSKSLGDMDKDSEFGSDFTENDKSVWWGW